MQRLATWKLTAVAACALAGAAAAAGALRAQEPVPRALAIDAVVLDSDGRPVPDLRAGQFVVTIDGAPRAVRSARFVYRGPGAEASARGAARASDPALAPLFEPRRTVLIVVDENSFPRGAEKTVANLADRLLDRFGPGDHVALVTIPLPADAMALSFTEDRTTIRDTLARIVGRGAPVDLLAGLDDAQAEARAAAAAATAATSAAAGAEGGLVTRPPDESRQEATFAKGQDASPGSAGSRPLDVVARLLSGLAVAPGPKSVILVTAGLGDADREAAGALRAQLQAAEAAAVASRSALYMIGLPALGRSGSLNDLEQLSLATGGGIFRETRNLDQALDRVALAMSGLYHLELDPAATDGDGRPHAVKVTVGRSSLTVRAARRLVVRDDPPFFAVPSRSELEAAARDLPGEPAAEAAKEASAARRGAPAADPELDTVVARAVEYIGGYFRDFRNVVAEEDYVQSITSMRPADSREIKSDFLLVTTADGGTWVPFRDVFEVDGRKIRDREDRLRKLFLESPPGTAYEAMARVQDEGSRYNMVSLGKTDINVPTFALTILLDRNLGSFTFRRGRQDVVDGLRLLRVDFEEVGRPTLIRSTDGGDVPSSGSLWVDPLTGRVVQTYLRAARMSGSFPLAGLTLESRVTYRRSDTLGLWVPAEMRETYRLRGNTVEGRAFYSKFRSFQVRTEQEIKVVKDE